MKAAGRSWRRKLFGRVLKLLGAALLLFVSALLANGWVAFGHSATGDRRKRVEASPEWHGGQFNNAQPMWNDGLGALTGLLHASADASPKGPVPTVTVDPNRFATPPGSGLRATWFGHSTTLIELDGQRVLTDPIFGDRASPISFLGPKRYYPPLLALSALPKVDAVIISHDHYDHLDQPTIAAMKDWDTTFIVPLGVGAHLAYWGVPESRIVELDWWERVKVGSLEITATPSRHASGRALVDNNATLWASWAIVGPSHRVWFSGDTGLFPALADIGTRLGPFDLTLIESGQYDPAWPDWHLGPEQAVQAHQMVQGRVLFPIHWALFTLAYHGWTEPGERALVAANKAGVVLALPKPGESIEPSALPHPERWWPDVPWRTAEQTPIVATRMK